MAAAMATAKTCFYVNVSQDGIVLPLTRNAICHIAQWATPCAKPAIAMAITLLNVLGAKRTIIWIQQTRNATDVL
jgi:hypothetical protein